MPEENEQLALDLGEDILAEVETRQDQIRQLDSLIGQAIYSLFLREQLKQVSPTPGTFAQYERWCEIQGLDPDGDYYDQFENFLFLYDGA